MPLPQKAIYNQADLLQFTQSPVYQEILGFVQALGTAAVGKRNSHDCGAMNHDSVVSRLTEFLQRLSELADAVPPLPQQMRFGNKAFVTWHGQMKEQAQDFLHALLSSTASDYEEEIGAYFYDSFGNTSRLDYGTGHETNFVAFLYCLRKVGILSEDDLPAVVLRVFDSYMLLLRKLQKVYMLEPAGSHGVWGLDDYQCLAFYFGAAQLVGNGMLEPSSIHNKQILQEHAVEYQYLAAIAFICEVKKGVPFQETSPMLSDISQLPSWQKVYEGLLRLYEGEVLKKFPVIQHLAFGQLLEATWRQKPV